MELIIKKRQYKPVFIIDVGVPSAIDPAIEQIDEVFLYSLDDLECLAMEGKKRRNSAITAAEQIIEEELTCFTENINKTHVEPLLRELIKSMNEERLKILRQKPELNSSQITQLLVNRLLHNPISTIRELSAKNEFNQTTELLVRKLLISRNKAEGDAGEL
jgi:glutamyl-tRNA reductase